MEYKEALPINYQQHELPSVSEIYEHLANLELIASQRAELEGQLQELERQVNDKRLEGLLKSEPTPNQDTLSSITAPDLCCLCILEAV